MYFYEKISGSYYLKDENCKSKILSMMDKVSVLFDVDLSVLLKHGKPDSVNQYAKTIRETFVKANELLPEEARVGTNFKVITSNRWKEKELNWMLQCSGYVKYLETDPNRFFE